MNVEKGSISHASNYINFLVKYLYFLVIHYLRMCNRTFKNGIPSK
jgi:hypothetical protein